MRHTLKAVFDDRDKAQQALEELLASGYARADTDLVTIPGARSASADDARAPRWRAHPGTSSARLLSRFLGHANRLPVAAHSPAAADSHVLTLSTDSDQEAERAVSLLSGAMAAGHRPGLSPGDTAFQEGPKGMPSLDDAARTAYHFGRDMHENDRIAIARGMNPTQT